MRIAEASSIIVEGFGFFMCKTNEYEIDIIIKK